MEHFLCYDMVTELVEVAPAELVEVAPAELVEVEMCIERVIFDDDRTFLYFIIFFTLLFSIFFRHILI